MSSDTDHSIEWKPYDEICTEIYFDGAMVGFMMKRPGYCDRGHWTIDIQIYKMFNGFIVPLIDDADKFPRYYMRKEVAISETEEFLRWRFSKEMGHDQKTSLSNQPEVLVSD
jgi:hypothetical protein